MNFIPLLSIKDLHSMTEDEFHRHVKSLFFIKEKRRTEKKAKKKRILKLKIKVTKKGKLSVSSRRSPSYFTPGELAEASKQTGKAENELFILLKEKGYSQREHE